MTDTDPSVTRRSVLQATGAAMGVGLGATGTGAGAPCSDIWVRNDVYLLDGNGEVGNCVDQETAILVERGSSFEVQGFCDSNGHSAGGNKYYQVYLAGFWWIHEQHVECI